MTCSLLDCERPVNRDGVCFPHKLSSVRFGGMTRLANEREQGTTQAEMARETIETAKANGTEIQSTKRWI